MRGRGAAALALALALGACRGDDPPPAPRPAEAPTSVFERVELVDQDPDGTRWRLEADRGHGREIDATGVLEGVRAELIKDGRTVGLIAGAAELGGGVELRLSRGVEIAWDGYRVRVDTATYHRGAARVSSPDAVELTGPGLWAQGRGVEVDVERRNVRVAGGVKAVLQRGDR